MARSVYGRRVPIATRTALLLTALLVAACNGTEAEPDLDIGVAIERTREHQTATVDFQTTIARSGEAPGRVNVGGLTRLNDGTGQFGVRGHSVPGLPHDGDTTHVVLGPRDTYVQGPYQKAWVHYPGETRRFAGLDVMLGLLEYGTQKLEHVGEDTVYDTDSNTVPATQYKGTVDLDVVEEKLPNGERATFEQLRRFWRDRETVPVEVWVDEEGRIRRVRTELPLGLSALLGEESRLETEVEISGFDSGFEIQIPPEGPIIEGPSEPLPGSARLV